MPAYINNKGSVTITLLIATAVIVFGYFGYLKMLGPEKVEKGLIEGERQAAKILEEFSKNGAVKFKFLVPAYTPSGYHLIPGMGPSQNGNRFNFIYLNSQGERLDISQENVSAERKKKIMADQKKFPYKRAAIAPGVEAVVGGGEVTQAKEKIPGTNQELNIRFGMREYSFFARDIYVTVANSITQNGELLSETELLSVARSMLAENAGR